MSDPAQPSDKPPADPSPPETNPPAGETPATPAAAQSGQPLAVVPPGQVLPAPPKSGTLSQSNGPTGVAVPIDYAMPAQKKSWLPSPALIRNLGCIFKMLFGFTVLLILGYVMLMALNPKARQWALQGSQPSAPGLPAAPGAASDGGFGRGAEGSGIGGGRGPTPFKTVNQILAIPAQALGKTDDVVQANNARVGQLDGVIAEEEAKGKGTAKGGPGAPPVNPFLAAQPAAGAAPGATAAPGAKAGAEPTPEELRAAQAARMLALQEKIATSPDAPKADPVRSTAIPSKEPEALAPVTLPGGIVIRSASPVGAPAATRTFLYWVVNLNLSGINPPRLLLNGRLVHEGQEVNIAMGIVLERIDPAGKLLHFRDSTGAVVTRSY